MHVKAYTATKTNTGYIPLKKKNNTDNLLPSEIHKIIKLYVM
jgi:hypothetical protein